jgi:hypothetical protein
LRVYHLLIGIILLALSPFIFKSVFKKAPTNNEVKPQQPVPSPTVPSTPKAELIPGLINVVVFKPVGIDLAVKIDYQNSYFQFLNHS